MGQHPNPYKCRFRPVMVHCARPMLVRSEVRGCVPPCPGLIRRHGQAPLPYARRHNPQRTVGQGRNGLDDTGGLAKAKGGYGMYPRRGNQPFYGHQIEFNGANQLGQGHGVQPPPVFPELVCSVMVGKSQTRTIAQWGWPGAFETKAAAPVTPGSIAKQMRACVIAGRLGQPTAAKSNQTAFVTPMLTPRHHQDL